MVITKPTIIFQTSFEERCFHFIFFSLVITWKCSEKGSLTSVIYVSCLWNMNPIPLTLFTQHLESLLVCSSSSETRRICFPSPSKIDLIGVVNSKTYSLQPRDMWVSRMPTLCSFLSLLLFTQTRLGLLLYCADIMGMGILKILMHKWSMLHCTCLWHMFYNGCCCCCCLLKQETNFWAGWYKYL